MSHCPLLLRRLLVGSLLVMAGCLALASCGAELVVDFDDDATPSPTPVAPTAPDAPSDSAATPEADELALDSADEASGEEDQAATPTATPVELVVYNDDFATSIAPILVNGCASCHNAAGPGASHWRLETADDAMQTSQYLASVVSSGYMPPWPASDDGLVFKNHRGLTDDQRDAIIAWAAAGGAIDVAPETPLTSASGPPALDDVDASITPAEPYQGSTSQRDDYRCQIYDPGLSEQAWIDGYNFVPDKAEVVHHAIGYLVPAEALATAQALDERDPGAGWECFGGAGIRGVDDDIFLAWAPGQDPTQFPSGAALRIGKGDFVVIQIHYHYESTEPADASALELSYVSPGENEPDRIVITDYLAPAEIPCGPDEGGPLCDRDAAIAQAIEKYGREGVLGNDVLRYCGYEAEDFAELNNGIATASCVLPVFEFGEIISILGHEHELGASFRMTLNPGDPDEQVLLDIPKWDFNWQYNYEPAEPIILERGDRVEIECSWDRSLRDPTLEPAYVIWADGTDDEMCFATITTRSLG